MKSLSEQAVGLIVKKDFRIASIFRNYKIDFKSKTNLTLKKACDLAGVSNSRLEKEIIKVISEQENFNIHDLRLDLLTDYIEAKFHRYFYNQTPIIIALLTEIAERYSLNEPEFLRARSLFLSLSERLIRQMMLEEKDLFSAIRNMVSSIENQKKYNTNLGDVKSSIFNIKKYESANVNSIKSVIEIMSNYLHAEDSFYNRSLTLLREYKENLNTYIELQNTVLFSESIKIEDSLSMY